MNATAVDHILLCFIQYCIYTDDGLSNKTETFEMFAFFVVIYFCILISVFTKTWFWMATELHIFFTKDKYLFTRHEYSAAQLTSTETVRLL